jgi:hypothetical protein
MHGKYLPCNFQIIEHPTLPEDPIYSPTPALEAEIVVFATDREIPVIEDLE